MTELVVARSGNLSFVVRPSPGAGRRPPVLCFLHGEDAGAKLGPLGAAAPPCVDEFLVVAPRLPARGDAWREHAQEVWEIAFDAARRYDGDRRALCLTGFGSGGDGVFELAAALPGAWAALWSVDAARVPAEPPPIPLWLSNGATAYEDARVYDWMLIASRSRRDRT